MNREPVESSNIASIGYDADTRTLQIEFNGGAVYNYHPVTEDGHRSLISAPSIGKYFSANIRNNDAITTTKE